MKADPAAAGSGRREAKRPRVDSAAFASLGPGQLRPGRESDEIDRMLPQAVITARDTEQIRDAVAQARSRRLGIVVSGGATMLHVGAVPRAYDIRLTTTAIGNVLEQNPEDMTVTCEAGVTLARLQRSLAKVGQRLAIDVADDERASIGGIVAGGLAGGLRYGFGLPRDLLLGLRGIDGAGRELVTGGRVVKNVAGYDLTRLLAGSFGTLAVITAATLRTHPLPEAAATLIFEFVDAAELDGARARLFAAPLPLAALDFAVDASASVAVWMLVVRVEGSEAEVAFQGDAVCASVGRDPAQALETWTSPAHVDHEDGVTIRIGAASSAIVATVQAVVASLRERVPAESAALAIGGHLGAGVARLHLSSPSQKSLEALLAATEPGGAIAVRVVERAPAEVKRGLDVWGPAPPTLPLMRELKRRFDPDDVLAPGRFVGGI